MQWKQIQNSVLVAACLLPMTCYGGGAAVPETPSHMPNAPMPAFNFFVPKPSGVSTAHVQETAPRHKSKTQAHASMTSVKIEAGSLKANIVRLSQQFGWQHVIWLPTADYHWIGNARVAAKNLPDILNKILINYPLQADFYLGNHVLVIKPRTLQS